MVVLRIGQLELPMGKWAHHGIMLAQFLKVNKVGLDTHHNLLQNEFLLSCYILKLFDVPLKVLKRDLTFCKWDTDGFKNSHSFLFFLFFLLNLFYLFYFI